MNIEALVAKHFNPYAIYGTEHLAHMRNALTEQAEAFKGELQAYDGMVRELTKAVEDMQGAARPKDKPEECVNGCPVNQVCDYCQRKKGTIAAVMECGTSVPNVYEAYKAGKKAAQSVDVVGPAVAQNPSRMCVVFDGPPSSEAPRFIEVEDGNGNSINAGEWLKRDDGLWELRLIAHLPLRASTATSIPAAELATLREKAAVADNVKADLASSVGQLSVISARLEQVEQERDELRKDAERYRWLRDGNDNKKSAACHIAVNCYGLEWDAAIDAAIAQGKGE